MSQERESFAGQKELINDPIEQAEREASNAVEQFDLVLAQVQRADKFKFTTRTINELQEAALRGIHPLAGTFRNTPVTIRGSTHAPPHHLDVPDEVAALCLRVNTIWDTSTAIHLGAYVLWKLNWIHPFADGNGRTARAASYLVMSKKLGGVLPGTPTIPEQIAVDKAPYYDALEAADAASNGDLVDVSQLEGMLEDMLVKQLLSRPSLPDVASRKINTLLELRLSKAPDELLKSLYGTSAIKSQLWAIGDYVVLQIGSCDAIQEAEGRQRKYRNPFPRLLAFGDTDHVRHIGSGESNSSLVLDESLGEKYALLVDRECFVAVQPHCLAIEGEQWGSDSWLYVVRLGSTLTGVNFPDAIDLLLARQLSRAAIQ